MEALPLAEARAALIRAGQECGRNRQPRPCMGRGCVAVGAAGRYPKRRFWRWEAYRCGTGVSLLLKTGSGFLSERTGGFCRWKKIGQFSKIRCNLPLYRIQYKYRAGPIDADGSSAYIFIGRMILTCGGIEKTEKDEMRSTMSDMIG